MRAWMCDRCDVVQRPKREDRINKRPEGWGTVRFTVSPSKDALSWLICPDCQPPFLALLGPSGGDWDDDR